MPHFFHFEKNKSSGRLFAKGRRLLQVFSCRCGDAVSPGVFIHGAHFFPSLITTYITHSQNAQNEAV